MGGCQMDVFNIDEYYDTLEFCRKWYLTFNHSISSHFVIFNY